MSRNAEGMFDDLSGLTADPPAAPDTPTPAASVEETVDTGQKGRQEPAKAAEKPAAEKPDKSDPANSPARPDGYVPKQALEEARLEMKREREARERAEANFQKFLDRWQSDQDRGRAEAEPEVDPDDWTGDPNDYVGQIEWLKQKTRDVLAERRQQQRAAQTQGEVQRIVVSQAERFGRVKAEHPVLDQAYQHLLNSVAGENAVWGVSGPDLKARVDQWEMQVAQWAHANNQPIEDVIWRLAQERGFRPPAAAGDGQEQQRQAPDAGKDAPQRDQQGRFVSPEQEKAARLAESQERNGSLSQASGVPVERMSAKDLGKMSEDEMWNTFEKFSRRKGGKEFDRAMGFRS